PSGHELAGHRQASVRVARPPRRPGVRARDARECAAGIRLRHYRWKMSGPPSVSGEAWQHVGRENVRVSDPVSMRHLREYLAGAAAWNPLYCDEESAKRPHYEGIAAPPLFFLVASRRVVPMARLLEDGQYDDVMVPGVNGVSVLAGWDIEVDEPIRIGDVIT